MDQFTLDEVVAARDAARGSAGFSNGCVTKTLDDSLSCSATGRKQCCSTSRNMNAWCGAARAVVRDSGYARTGGAATNGWTFWRFVDTGSVESPLQALRRM